MKVYFGTTSDWKDYKDHHVFRILLLEWALIADSMDISVGLLGFGVSLRVDW